MGRDREEKGIGKLRFKTEDRQTDRQPPRLCKDHRQSPTPSSLPDSPLNWAHSLSAICLPPIPKELVWWRGALVVVFLPEATAQGAPGNGSAAPEVG